jgi:ADP-heptose:LPS heptosyltransferase
MCKYKEKSAEFVATRILVVQMAGIGDVLLTSPAVSAMRKRWPEARIDILVRPLAKDVFARNPDVHRVITFNKEADSTWSLIRAMRARKYDLLVDYHGSPRTMWYSLLGGAKLRVTYGGGRLGVREKFYNHPVQARGTYTAEDKISLLRDFGVGSDAIRPLFYPDSDSLGRAEKFISEHALQSGPGYVAISPHTAFPTKKWADEHWVALARALREEFGFKVVCTQGPGDVAHTASLVAAADGAIIAAPADSFSFLYHILANARFMIADDSGPKHFAVVCDTPTLTLTGSTEEDSWTFPSPRHMWIANPLECRPCHTTTCRFGTIACMRDLSVKRVLEAFRELRFRVLQD